MPPSSTPANTVSINPVMAASRSEISRADSGLIHIRRPARQRHVSFLQTIEAIGTSQSPGNVLLDHDHAGAVLANAGNHLIDIFNDDRREAEADFVAQQYRRIRHQRPSDRDHLLLPTRKYGDVAFPALAQNRKHPKDRVDIPR